MMETASMIQQMLTAVGETLYFEGFSIKGIPGFDVSILMHGESSPYEVERQNFSFQIATADYKTYNVVKFKQFYMTDGTYNYNFTIDRPPINDLTGWSQLLVNLSSRIVA